jgi:hypothetical protein
MRKPLNTLLVIRVEEQRLAKRDIRDELRRMGLRPASITMAQLNAEARKRSWCYAHIAARHIFRYALDEALRRAELKSDARKAEADKSMASAVQMSSTLEGVK